MIKLKDIFYPFIAWKNLFKEPVTVKDPLNREASDRYRGFHQNDLTKCIGCGTCEDICQNKAIDLMPVKGIETKKGNSGLRPVVDYGRCCWCALCVDVCTTSSLTMSKNYQYSNSDADTFRFLIGGVDKNIGVNNDGLKVNDNLLAHKIDNKTGKLDKNAKANWNNYKAGYKRPDNYTLVPLERVEMDMLGVNDRSDSFIEIIRGYSQEQAEKEADRCVSCGICTATCPAHMDIPGYIKAIRDRNVEEGLRILYETNPLPEVCGRICTHKCEEVCSIGYNGDPLAIRWLKRYIADQIPLEDYKRILGPENDINANKKIAIVGAGPAGLSAAYYLGLIGYSVEIFESLPEAGGMMRYGIPEYRLPYDTLDKDIEYIKSIGVKIHTNTAIGKDIELKKLENDFDAVFIATGLHTGRTTGIKGSDGKGIYQAITLLRDITEGKDIEVAENIIVVGGGNVAMDIARSMARLQKEKYGKVSITLTALESKEMLPADVEEVEEAEEEGVKIIASCGPREICRNKDGKLTGLDSYHCVSIFDEDHRFNPKFDETKPIHVDGDVLIEAIGQGMDLKYLESYKDLEFGERGRIKVDEKFQSSLKWLFAGGDIIQGPDVITGISNGHVVALAIDKYLEKTSKINKIESICKN